MFRQQLPTWFYEYPKEKAASIDVSKRVVKVAAQLHKNEIKPFCAMLVNAWTEIEPDREASIKTQVSYIRRVLTAIIVDQIKVEPDESLRAIYARLPKKKTGAKTHKTETRKTETHKTKGEKLEIKASPDDLFIEAVRTIFGYVDPDLVTAMKFVSRHTVSFVDAYKSGRLLNPTEQKTNTQKTTAQKTNTRKTAARAAA